MLQLQINTRYLIVFISFLFCCYEDIHNRSKFKMLCEILLHSFKWQVYIHPLVVTVHSTKKKANLLSVQTAMYCIGPDLPNGALWSLFAIHMGETAWIAIMS